MSDFYYSDYLEMLNSIDPNLMEPEWWKVIVSSKMAGLSLNDVDIWSSKSRKYKGLSDVKKRYDNASTSEHGNITKKTLYKIASEYGYKIKIPFLKLVSIPPEIIEKPETPKTQEIDINLLWELCKPADDFHPYIIEKNGSSEGIRYYPTWEKPYYIANIDIRGYLAVPAYNEKGEIQTIQFFPIKSGEKKLFPKNVKSENSFFSFGDNTNFIMIAEGLGHLWTCQKILKLANEKGYFVNTFGSGRLEKISKIIRQKFPNSTIIICSDKGMEDKCRKIGKDVKGHILTLPGELKDNFDINDYEKEFGINKCWELFKTNVEQCFSDEIEIIEVIKEEKKSKYISLNIEEIRKLPNIQWLLKGFFPLKSVCVLYGPSGVGKSFIALDLALSICTGSEKWFGRKLKKVPVTYLCLEGEYGIKQRIDAWIANYIKIHGKQPLIENFNVIIQPFSINSTDVDDLIQNINENNANNGLLIIDTLSCCAGGLDENTFKDMSLIRGHSKRITIETGVVTLLVSHTGKDEDKGIRGHSSLFSDIDGCVFVGKDQSGCYLMSDKTKDGVLSDKEYFYLSSVSLGVDEDRDPITSCVIQVFNDSEIDVQKTNNTELDSIEKRIYEELKLMIMASKKIGRQGVPKGKYCIDAQEAIDTISNSQWPDDNKNRKNLCRRQITKLIQNDLIGMDKKTITKAVYFWLK